MSKAAAELPDSLEPGAPGSDKVGVDDLLAQMAGEEIDRLLSEDDDPHALPPPPSHAAPPSPASPAPVEVQVTKQIDELFSSAPAAAPVSTVPPSAPVNVPPSDQALSKQLDELFEPDSDRPAEATARKSEVETTSDERSALGESLADESPQSEEEIFAQEAPLPFYLKPLAWMNAPLDSLSDSTRALIGKLALLTMFNAALVLVYVLVFRKHH